MEETYFDDESFTNMKQNRWIKTIQNNSISKKVQTFIKSENNLIKEENSLKDNFPPSEFELQPKFNFVVYRSIYQKENNLKFTYDTVEYQEHKFVVFCLSGIAQHSLLIETTCDEDFDVFESCLNCRSKIIEVIWRSNKELYKILQDNNVIPDLKYSSFNFEPLIVQRFDGNNSLTGKVLKKRKPRLIKCAATE